MSNAQTEDTSLVKSRILNLMLPDPKLRGLDPPIPYESAKAARGFNHPMTARLLCPRKDLHIFDQNPEYVYEALNQPTNLFSREYMANVKADTIKILAGDLPTFLYDENVAFNLDEPEVGLLEGYLAIRV